VASRAAFMLEDFLSRCRSLIEAIWIARRFKRVNVQTPNGTTRCRRRCRIVSATMFGGIQLGLDDLALDIGFGVVA
jgi:hypothetical protein